MMDRRHVEVIVPARNEEHHITACLTRIHHAMDRLRADQSEMSCGYITDLATGDSACA